MDGHNGGLPSEWKRIALIDGMALFEHESGGTAVFAYEYLFDHRRVMITMRGVKSLPAARHLESLFQALVPDLPMRWTLGAIFGGSPYTLCVIEDDGNPLPVAFQFSEITREAY